MNRRRDAALRRAGFSEAIIGGLPFDQLTARLMLARHRDGTLNPKILEYLLAGVGLWP
jgi:hypothetical protein